MIPKLPDHAAEILWLFGFPHGADLTTGPSREGLFWRSYDDGSIVFQAMCSDTFWWGTADGEDIEPEDMPLLRQCLEDLKAVHEEYLLPELFASRKRKMRPMRLWLGTHPSQLNGTYAGKGGEPEASLDLFLAAGPDRDPASEG